MCSTDIRNCGNKIKFAVVVKLCIMTYAYKCHTHVHRNWLLILGCKIFGLRIKDFYMN